jgi:hypothetical protein
MAGATGFTTDGQPSRPYSSPDQLGGATPRTREFTTGQVGDPGNAATSMSQNAGLNLNSQQFMD